MSLLTEVGQEGGCVYVGAVGIQELSVLFAQSCCEPKTALRFFYLEFLGGLVVKHLSLM